MNLAQNVSLMFSRSNLKRVTWGKKQGHQAKSKEDFVNTLEKTFLM